MLGSVPMDDRNCDPWRWIIGFRGQDFQSGQHEAIACGVDIEYKVLERDVILHHPVFSYQGSGDS